MPVRTRRKPSDTEMEGTKFYAIYLVSIYKYAKVGLPEAAIAEGLKVQLATFKGWKKKFPSIKKAIEMGRTDTNDGGNWHKFFYDRLPLELQKLWNRLDEFDDAPNGVAMAELLLNDHGKVVRQQLFLHALIHNNFSASKAMAKVCIDKDTLDYWVKHDPKFAELVEQIHWHKGNFFEESLISLIKGGDTGATIFANRTYNKERGYGNSIAINHSGQIDHNHSLDLSELDLKPETRHEIMEAIRLREERLAKQKLQPALEAEFRIIENLTQQIATVPQEEGVVK